MRASADKLHVVHDVDISHVRVIYYRQRYKLDPAAGNLLDVAN
jgi:hypothetical protein